MTHNALNKQKYEQLLEKILEHKITHQPLIIAIDGRCCSGKTTLARKLSQDINATILPMDDFFLRPEQRNEKRYQQPGGNVDYERVEDVILQYLNKEDVSYCSFDCRIGQLGDMKRLTYKDILIVEGSYSLTPTLINYAHYKIFMTLNESEQLNRIEQRNGQHALKMFKEKWIPLEENYFNTLNIENQCDICFDTSL